MGDIRPGVPLPLVAMLRNGLGLASAIETGTFRGDSAAALSTVFDEVWTIELSHELHRSAVARFSEDPRIHVIQGSSLDVLGTIASDARAPTLYWLDGHWSGGLTAGQGAECPLIGELGLIDSSQSAADSCILIDDARLFLGPPPPPHKRDQWPTFADVFDRIRSAHPRFVTLIEDVIVAVPPQGRAFVEEYWLDLARTRATGKPRLDGSAIGQRLRQLRHRIRPSASSSFTPGPL